jgi:3-phosphoshikimate 1-carboxyvinyltransferase
MARRLIVRKTGAFRGTIRPPSDKSLTHRAYMFAALSRRESDDFIPAVDGPGAVGGIQIPCPSTSIINYPLNGEDCESTLNCLVTLGAEVRRISATQVHITPPMRWVTEPVVLDCGNSGTTMRLLSGILAGIEGIDATVIGDESLSRRPMGRITKPLQEMGADITGDTAPVRIRGKALRAIQYQSPVASAQVKSAVLLAGLRTDGRTTVTEPALSRDHTERMFTALGIDLDTQENSISVNGGQQWNSFEFTVPGDISSAAFFMVASLLHPQSEVTFRELGVNPSRTGVLDLFAKMFPDDSVFELKDTHEELGEPVATVIIGAPKILPAFEIAGEMVPALIDEIPILAVLATQCHGTTVIRDAQELRVKETDRIAVVTENLKQMGADITATDDGMIINGPTPLHGTTVDSSGDHRIGMSFAIAGTIATGETIIENVDSIRTSYPEFVPHLTELSGFVPEVIE